MSRAYDEEKGHDLERFATPQGHGVFSQLTSLAKAVHGLVAEVATVRAESAASREESAAARAMSAALKAEMKEVKVFSSPFRRKIELAITYVA